MTHQLEVLVADGVIDEVLGRLKSGKEADISLVRRGDEVLAAKVYKDRATRSFKNNADYKEGRKVRNSRTQRAIDSGGRFGRDAAEQAWKSAEADALYKLQDSGVRVPQPFMFYEGVLLMEVVRDEAGRPAPRLIDVAIEPEAACSIFADLVAQIISMLCCDLIHGDLSPYNILAAADGPTIIDFPQVVSAVHSSRAEYFFLRDFDNVVRFLSGFDPSLAIHRADGRSIWRAYVTRELTPQFVPPPPPPERPRHQDRPRRDQGRPPQRPDQRPPRSDQRPRDDRSGQRPPQRDDRSGQHPPQRDDRSAQRPPQRDDRSGQRPPQRDDRSGQRPPQRDDRSGQRPPQRDDRSAQRPPQRDDRSGQRPPPRDDRSGQRPPPRDDRFAQRQPPQRTDQRDDRSGQRPPPQRDDRSAQRPPPQRTDQRDDRSGQRPPPQRTDQRSPQRTDQRDDRSGQRPPPQRTDQRPPQRDDRSLPGDQRAPQRTESRAPQTFEMPSRPAAAPNPSRGGRRRPKRRW